MEMCEDNPSDESANLDPRVQDELEALNESSDTINKLENELEKAKVKFRNVKLESAQMLSKILKSLGKKCVHKAMPYYDLSHKLHKAQLEAQKVAARFQEISQQYQAAKDSIELAEQEVIKDREKLQSFDPALQDKLNQATIKLMEAKQEQTACETEHQLKASQSDEIGQQMAAMLNEMPSIINKARLFYEMKDLLEKKLKAERQNAEDLHLAIICSKQRYKMALQNLELISNEVHARRKNLLALPPRTPGVGAETDCSSELSDFPSIYLNSMSEMGSLDSDSDSDVEEEANLGRMVHSNMSGEVLENQAGSEMHLYPESAKRFTSSLGPMNFIREETLEGAESTMEKIESKRLSQSADFRTNKPVINTSSLSASSFGYSEKSTSGEHRNQSSAMINSCLPKGVYVASKNTKASSAQISRSLSKDQQTYSSSQPGLLQLNVNLSQSLPYNFGSQGRQLPLLQDLMNASKHQTPVHTYSNFQSAPNWAGNGENRGQDQGDCSSYPSRGTSALVKQDTHSNKSHASQQK